MCTHTENPQHNSMFFLPVTVHNDGYSYSNEFKWFFSRDQIVDMESETLYLMVKELSLKKQQPNK